ncbi:unnamed protein product, partial [Prorocentrum cordatum]
AESEEESDEPLLESTRGSARDWRGRPPCGGPRACLPAAAAAIVLLTLLLAEGGGPHVDPRRRRRAARASGSKDGVTQLETRPRGSRPTRTVWRRTGTLMAPGRSEVP